jgi:predicted nucleic acid-binding protein
MKLIIDASMALAWLFERQKRQEAVCANNALQAIAKAEVVCVPSLWHTEIANALLVGERRHVITEAQVIDYLNKLFALPIKTDSEVVSSRITLVMALAREHQLTGYDATYLELALRTSSTLATFDEKLAKAMRSAGGILFENIS